MITLTELLKQTSAKIKSPHFSKKVWLPAAAVALIVVSGGSWAAHTVSVRNAEQDRQSSIAEAKKLKEEQAKELAKKQSANRTSANPKNSQQPTASEDKEPTATKDASKPSVKYSTSSDPRSTAYSTTPPVNQSDFVTRVTHAGQVAPGTLIAYNSAKNYHNYYAGDLLLSPSTITISKSNPGLYSRNITISSPTSHYIGMASLPWDEPPRYFIIATHNSSDIGAAKTSYDMFVDFATPLPDTPTGQYQLHIGSGWTQGDDGWECDGFITINVVD